VVLAAYASAFFIAHRCAQSLAKGAAFLQSHQLPAVDVRVARSRGGHWRIDDRPVASLLRRGRVGRDQPGKKAGLRADPHRCALTCHHCLGVLSAFACKVRCSTEAKLKTARSWTMRLLLVEDDTTLGDAVREYLREQGHVVDWALCVADARAAVFEAFDAILLDWRLPDGSGVDWLRQLRTHAGVNQHAAVLLLTARDQLNDRIEGLDAGADDYLVKPFELGELAARLRAVTRRSAAQSQAVLRAGAIALDPAARSVAVSGQPVELTAREYALAEALIRRSGRIVSRADLEQLLYGYDREIGSNTVEVHMSSLRRKLGREAIETVRGMGYRIRR
jgi:two-component system OmpR family response regulator